MTHPHSDALVFFGATGDLAYKKIFPSLQAMVKRSRLTVPVIGMAKAGGSLKQLGARARDAGGRPERCTRRRLAEPNRDRLGQLGNKRTALRACDRAAEG